MIESTPEAAEAITKARTYVVMKGLDLGPVVACRHVTRALVRELLRDADPSDPAYETGVRVSLSIRDHWAIHFELKIPDGVVQSPSWCCIRVFDDTGEVE